MDPQHTNRDYVDRRADPGLDREYFTLQNKCSTHKQGLSVQQTSSRLAHHITAGCRLMHETAELILNLPELEVKLLLGRHLHDFASIVDTFADRFRTLAEPLRVEYFDQLSPKQDRIISQTSATVEALSKRYEEEVPNFLANVQTHLQEAHPVWDEPTVRLLGAIAEKLHKQLEEYKETTQTLDRTLPDWRNQLEHLSDTPSTDSWKVPHRPARDSRFAISPTIPRRPQGGTVKENAIADFHIAMMHIEVPTIELCCENILLFPNMPWDFKRDMARQIWDETRHAQAFHDRIIELGGEIGAFPADFNIREMTEERSLALRLSVNQQIGEWIGVDSSIYFGNYYLQEGDLQSAQLFEFVSRDEVNHTHFGNKWMKYLLGTQEAISRVHEEALQIRAQANLKMDTNFPFPFNQWICEASGFSPEQITRMIEVRKRPPQ